MLNTEEKHASMALSNDFNKFAQVFSTSRCDRIWKPPQPLSDGLVQQRHTFYFDVAIRFVWVLTE